MATAKDETLTVLEIDALTGIQTVRELTVEELAEYKIGKTQAAAQEIAIEAKATARASALAKLAELGLTAEEIAAL
jgi:hypothetical protein